MDSNGKKRMIEREREGEGEGEGEREGETTVVK